MLALIASPVGRWVVAGIGVAAFIGFGAWIHSGLKKDFAAENYESGWSMHAALSRTQIEIARAGLALERAKLALDGAIKTAELETTKAALAAATRELEQEARNAAPTHPGCAPSAGSIRVHNDAIDRANGAAP